VIARAEYGGGLGARRVAVRRPHPPRLSPGADLALVALALFALVGVLFATACSAPKRSLPARSPVATEPAPLRVGTSGDYPPFSVRNADGSLGGFDVAVALAYARDRGRRVDFVPFRWPELGERLLAGDFDVAMSGVTVRADRLVAGIMTSAVAQAEAVLMTRADRPRGDFDRPERTIAVNRGGHLERVARARFPRATLVAVDDNRRLPELLQGGQVDALVTDTLEAAIFGLTRAADGRDGAPTPAADATAGPRNPARGAYTAGVPGDGPFVIAARLGRDRKAYWLAPANAALAADLDAWLLAREQDGLLPELRVRHLGSPSLSAPPVESALAPAVDGLVDLVARRLMLMPSVAAAKRAAGLPIEDRAREAAVEEAAAGRAAADGLAAPEYRALIRAEIAAAKAVQSATSTGEAPSNAAPLLTAVRTAIERIDAAILARLVCIAPVRAPVDVLLPALRADADLPGLNDRLRRAIAEAITRVQRRDVARLRDAAPGRRG
jgi:cyclohexadienyl dehydratase